MVEQKFLSYGKSRISYLQFGSGPRLAICFHGYGEEAGSFEFLDNHAGNQFTFLSIDLPFHGKTEWKEGLNFTPDNLFEIVNKLQEKEGTDSPLATPHSSLTILGFSLGGRVALSLYERIPGKIEKMILLAPDGLKVNSWYWLATQSWIGNKFFAFTMKYPGWFFGFLKILNKIGLVNVSIFKFVNYYIGDREVRNLLYARWTGLRKLKPGINKIKSLISKNATRVKLIYGKHDRIILSPVGERFRKGIEDHCELLVIHSGHQVLHEKHISEILPALLY